jgi:hypothetical protein
VGLAAFPGLDEGDTPSCASASPAPLSAPPSPALERLTTPVSEVDELSLVRIHFLDEAIAWGWVSSCRVMEAEPSAPRSPTPTPQGPVEHSNVVPMVSLDWRWEASLGLTFPIWTVELALVPAFCVPFFFLAVLGFELRVSCLLGWPVALYYHLNHSASPSLAFCRRFGISKTDLSPVLNP